MRLSFVFSDARRVVDLSYDFLRSKALRKVDIQSGFLTANLNENEPQVKSYIPNFAQMESIYCLV
jgi:hypothetical protein